MEELWAQTNTYQKDNNCNFFDPISIDTKIKCSNEFLAHMDPKQTIYGCASCGIWVSSNIKDKIKFKKNVIDLVSYQLTAEQFEQYKNIPNKYRKLKSVISCKNGLYYHLYRHLTSSKMSALDLDNITPLSSVELDEEAYLCRECYNSKRLHLYHYLME